MVEDNVPTKCRLFHFLSKVSPHFKLEHLKLLVRNDDGSR